MDTVQLLKARRIELGISQGDLAKYIGFEHRSSIHRVETGKLEWKLRDVIKACELLDLTLAIKRND